MNITESILQRRSVRTYTGKPLDEATVQKIKDYIADLKPPFRAKCRIVLLNTAATSEPVKLGTYGFVKGATDYLALIVEGDDWLAEEGAAYVFEQVVPVLYFARAGDVLAGRLFQQGDFKKQLTLSPGEKIRIVSPAGYAADKPHSVSFRFLAAVNRNHANLSRPISSINGSAIR